jgi:hypothetical protein
MNKFENAKTLKVVEITFLSKYKRKWGHQEGKKINCCKRSNECIRFQSNHGPKGGSQLMHLQLRIDIQVTFSSVISSA